MKSDPTPTAHGLPPKERVKLTNEFDVSDVIERLHRGGFTMSETTRILRIVLGMSRNDAKRAVVRHPSWSDVVDASEQIHVELERALDEDDSTTPRQ